MVTTEIPEFVQRLRESQEKDYPYFRRLWKNIVVTLLGVSFIPLLVIGGGVYLYTLSILEENTTTALRREVSDNRENIDHFLTERVTDLKLLASNLGVRSLTGPEALQKVFDSLRQVLPCFTDLGVIDDEGRHLAYVGPYDLHSKNYKETPWFKEVRERGFYVSDVFLGYRKAPHFIIAVKQATEGGFFILRATVDTLYFDRMVAEILSRRSGDAFMVNGEGFYQSTPGVVGELMGRSEFGNVQRFEGVRTEERDNQIIVMTWLEKVPWLYVARYHKGAIYEPVRQMRIIGVFIFLIAAMLIVGTILLVTSYLITRLETKRRSIRVLDHQLRHSSRMATAARLAPGFVRDINDTLSNIDMVVSWIRELMEKDLAREGTPDDLKESLNQIKSEIARGKKTTERFWKATRPSLPIVSTVNIHEFLEDILDMLIRELDFHCIAVKRDYQEGLPAVKSDPSQLRQVFQNLLMNAIHAIGREGEIRLTTRAGPQGVSVCVEDNGTGIPEEIIEKIFDPLFTAKPDGTGLGLSISRSILEKLGGKISAKSEPGKGATFVVELPLEFGPKS